MQSLGWGPILHTLSDTLSATQRQRIAGAFGVSYVAGNAVTWVLTAFLLSTSNWRLTFIIPPLLMFIVGIAWYFLSVPGKPAAVKSNLLNWPDAAMHQPFVFWRVGTSEGERQKHEALPRVGDAQGHLGATTCYARMCFSISHIRRYVGGRSINLETI